MVQVMTLRYLGIAKSIFIGCKGFTKKKQKKSLHIGMDNNDKKHTRNLRKMYVMKNNDCNGCHDGFSQVIHHEA